MYIYISPPFFISSRFYTKDNKKKIFAVVVQAASFALLTANLYKYREQNTMNHKF
jgi:hypothetical protein